LSFEKKLAFSPLRGEGVWGDPLTAWHRLLEESEQMFLWRRLKPAAILNAAVEN
jgi:hypothetical protein